MKKKFPIKRVILLILLAILAGLILWKVFGPKEEAPAAGAADEVNIEEIKRRTIVESVSGNGTVVAGYTESTRTEVTGTKITAIHIHEGDIVYAGTVIANLDTTDLEQRKRDLQDNYNEVLRNRSEQNQTYDERLSDSRTSRQERTDSTNTQLEEARADVTKYEGELAEAQAKANDLQDQVNRRNAEIDPLKQQRAHIEASINADQVHVDETIKYRGLVETDRTKKAEAEKAAADAAASAPAEGENADPAAQPAPAVVWTADDEARLAQEEARLAELEADYPAAQARLDADGSQYVPTPGGRWEQVNALTKQIQPMESEVTPIQQNLIQQQGVVNQKDTALRSARSRVESLENQLKDLGEQNDDNITDARKNYNDSVSDQLDNLSEQIKNVQEQIDNCTVRAGISGIVTSVPVSVGDRYNGGTIAVIENAEQFFIEAQIDEYDIPDIAVGMEARIKTDATRDEVLNGQVIFVAPSANTGNSSGLSDLGSLAGVDVSEFGGSSSSSSDATFLVRIALDQQNERLRLGMTASVSIITQSAEDVWTVPYEAVYERPDGSRYIEIVDPNAPVDENGNRIFSKKELDVEAGLEGTYYTEIRSDKITEGMEVVVPKSGGSDTLNELMNMMGADGGI